MEIDRKKEIERKKERLAQLRQQRLMRGESLGSLGSLSSIPSYTSLVNTSKEVEELVNQLIGPPGEEYFKLSRQESTLQEKENQPPPQPPKKVELVMQDVQLFELTPQDRVVYSKEIQTETLDSPEQVEPEPAELKIPEPASPEPIKSPPAKVQKELSEDEKYAMLISNDFCQFFEKSAKIMERALNEDYDILTDYNAYSSEYKVEEGIRQHRSFQHERWTKNRSVTDVQWSMRFPELLLGSYNKNTANINESDGLVLVWNVHLLERPEFVLHSQSDVMASRFSPFNPSIIVGGTYSGQVCVWDTRTKTTPVLTSSLSSPGHSHPIYSLSIIGTLNAHNLISASTDGTVCSWQLDMLTQPQDIIELVLPHEHNKTDEVAITCMEFQQQETTTFWVGTEEGRMYQANRFDRAGSKAGIDHGVSFVGHEGTITGMSFHPSSNSVELQSLLLTSSIDWTVKLWKIQVSFPNKGSKVGASTVVSPLRSFDEFDDYVSDIAWCPTHPAVFSTVDASGTVTVFNINDSDIPIARHSTAGRGLNKLGWNYSGDMIATAGLDGTIDVLDLSKVIHHRPDDLQRFSQTLREYRNEKV